MCLYCPVLWLDVKWCDSHSGASSSLQYRRLCSPPGSSVHGTLQEDTGVGCIPFSRGSSRPRDWTWVSGIEDGVFVPEPRGRPTMVSADSEEELDFSISCCVWACQSLSCVQLFAPPCSIASVHGILQARLLEWVAISIKNPIEGRDVNGPLIVLYWVPEGTRQKNTQKGRNTCTA